MNTAPKTPILRFKDEQGYEYPAWRSKTLREVAKVCRGKGLSKSVVNSKGEFPCILYGQLFTEYAETIETVVTFTDEKTPVTSKYGDILMPASGNTPSGLSTASALLVCGVQIGGDINIVRLNREVLPIFMSYLVNFHKEKFMRLVTGTAIKHIYARDIQYITFDFPTLQEQHKIADFLYAINTRIGQLSKKKTLLEQYKKGMMQKLFSQDIRFRNKHGKEYPDWEEKLLQEVATTKTGESNKADSSLTGKYTFFDRSQDIRTSDRYLFDTEAVIVPGEGKNFVPKFFAGKFDLHQRSYAIMNFKNATGKFIFYYIVRNQIHFLSQAVGSTVKSLRLPIFQKMPVRLPCIKEQQKIANFLSALDWKIELVGKQYKQAQILKKSLLQKMFV